ncbi:MAG: uroporphyrinogen-III C-methyltransferase [Lysobacter sp.]
MPTSLPDSSPRRRSRALLWLLIPLLALVAAGWYGWQWWQGHDAADRAASSDIGLRLDGLNERIGALRGDQRAQAQRLQQANTTNRVLRDELLGLGERSALIEESFAKYTDPSRHGVQALRLDEAELLLNLGQQRLSIAGDLDGARRAYALADGVLGGVDDPDYLSLRQTLSQERAALDALGGEPRALALARLDAWAQSIHPTPERDTVDPRTRPWWQRAFAGIVEVRHHDRIVALDPVSRADAQRGFQLEISLARAAAERRDSDSYRIALHRADDWLSLLVTQSEALQADRARLSEIAAMPLSLSLPTLGTTLTQLRQSRAARREPTE